MNAGSRGNGISSRGIARRGHARAQKTYLCNQWRICFVWRNDGAEDVEIVDYH
ncbi:MAG: hypothetical protein AB7S93_07160 [Xanthobacteraceae bacterium]